MKTRKIISEFLKVGTHCLLPTVAVALLTVHLPVLAQGSDSSACHKEVGSIDTTDGWDPVDSGAIYFKHVYQYKEEYPYFHYIGKAMLGIKNRRWRPRFMIPNFRYWLLLSGRKGSPSNDHYSIVDSISGNGNVRGVSLKYSSDGGYAFLLFNFKGNGIKETIEEGARISQGFEAGAWGVLTSVNGKPEFINQDRRVYNTPFTKDAKVEATMVFDSHSLAFSRGSNVGPEHLSLYFNFASQHGKKYLRSIFVEKDSVVIANQTHTRRRICRHFGITLAVTNSDTLRPALEEKLAAWGDAVHSSVVAQKKAEEAARQAANRNKWVKVAAIPRGREHRGPFQTRTGGNDIRIEHGPAEKSQRSNSVWADVYLVVNGVNLGKITSALVGEVRGIRDKTKRKNWEKIQRAFAAGDFRTHYHSSHYPNVYDDKRYIDCRRGCSIFVRAYVLKEANWKF